MPDVLDDLISHLLGEATFGRLEGSRKAGTSTSAALRMNMAGVFAFLASFMLFNVALGRSWRWPAIGFVASFVSLFVLRIAFGP